MTRTKVFQGLNKQDPRYLRIIFWILWTVWTGKPPKAPNSLRQPSSKRSTSKAITEADRLENGGGVGAQRQIS
jgi:hypothetical protein